jgi:hypothetical protein
VVLRADRGAVPPGASLEIRGCQSRGRAGGHIRPVGSVGTTGTGERGRWNHCVAPEWATDVHHGLHDLAREDRRDRHSCRYRATGPA